MTGRGHMRAKGVRSLPGSFTDPGDEELSCEAVLGVDSGAEEEDEIINVKVRILRHHVFHQSIQQFCPVPDIGVRVTGELGTT